MNGQSVKKELLRTGMGFFVFASGVVLLKDIAHSLCLGFIDYNFFVIDLISIRRDTADIIAVFQRYADAALDVLR